MTAAITGLEGGRTDQSSGNGAKRSLGRFGNATSADRRTGYAMQNTKKRSSAVDFEAKFTWVLVY